MIKDQIGSTLITGDQIGYVAYGAALMIEIIFQSCFYKETDIM